MHRVCAVYAAANSRRRRYVRNGQQSPVTIVNPDLVTTLLSWLIRQTADTNQQGGVGDLHRAMAWMLMQRTSYDGTGRHIASWQLPVMQQQQPCVRHVSAIEYVALYSTNGIRTLFTTPRPAAPLVAWQLLHTGRQEYNS